MSTTETPVLGAGTRLGAAELTVTDLDRSVGYYQDAIGLRQHRREGTSAALGAGGDDLLVLHENPQARPAGRHAGLFHFALLHPTREDLAHALGRAAVHRGGLSGASDHGVSEALYLRDPDGNGIELYRDRPRSEWPPPSRPGERVGMFTAALDLEALAALAAEPIRRHAGEGLVMGHMHLHVGDLSTAVPFYREVLGLEQTATYPGASFLAAGDYHHHLGINTWAGEGVPPAPADAVGLRRWTVVLDGEAERAALAARAQGAGAEAREIDGGLELRDPSGNAVLAVTG